MLAFKTNFGPEPCGLPPILPQVVAERLKRVTAHTSIRNILDFIAKKGFIHELYKWISSFNSDLYYTLVLALGADCVA